MKVRRCNMLLILAGSLLFAENTVALVFAEDNGPAAKSDSAEASSVSVVVQEQMSALASELRAIREENQQLKERLARLEQNQTTASTTVPTAAAASQAAAAKDTAAASQAAAAKDQDSTTIPEWAQNLMKNFTPFGEVGIRYQGFFGGRTGTPPESDNLYNNAQGLMRFGLKGQIMPKLNYVLRLSTGVSTEGGDPWIFFADPGDRRYVGLDQYQLTWQAFGGESLTSTFFGGKLVNIPSALGTTELLVDKDFGLHLFANLSAYKLSSKTSLSILTSVGFVTNGGAVGGRQLQPVVNNFPATGVSPGGTISDINQYGAPRANAYVAQLRGDHDLSSAVKIHASFGLVNISHPNDVPLFLGATNLLRIDGLRVPNMPQGTSTNMPRVLPLDANGFVDITAVNGVPAARLSAALVGPNATGDGASAFHILDTYGSVTLHADKKYPIKLFGDWARNLGAGAYIPGPAGGNDLSTPAGAKRKAQQQRDGVVAGIDFGTESKVKQHFASYKFVLIGSETTLLYVNNDQWHTNVRGHDFTYQYRFSEHVAPFFTLMLAQNYEPRLFGWSNLARYPFEDLRPGFNPWTWRPRVGVLVTF